MKTTLGWWVSRLKALGIQSTTYNKYPVSRLMQNKWHLTFLEKFSKNNSTSEVIWVKMFFFPYLWPPLVNFDGWHLFLTVRANIIEGGGPHTHSLWKQTVASRMQVCTRVKRSLALTSGNEKAVLLLMDYQKSFQRGDRHIGLTAASFFIVLMPLKTSFDQGKPC